MFVTWTGLRPFAFSKEHVPGTRDGPPATGPVMVKLGMNTARMPVRKIELIVRRIFDCASRIQAHCQSVCILFPCSVNVLPSQHLATSVLLRDLRSNFSSNASLNRLSCARNHPLCAEFVIQSGDHNWHSVPLTCTSTYPSSRSFAFLPPRRQLRRTSGGHPAVWRLIPS